MQPPTPGRSLAAEVERIKRHETGTDAEKTLVLFIHGLGREATETWGKFPELLQKDEQFAHKYRMGFFSYPTMLVRLIPFFSRKMPTIQELAAALRSEINNRYADFGNVVLVCHSLGGLIARKYLLEVKAKRELRVKGLVLFAGPNNGADLAHVSNTISWRHHQVRQLTRGSDILELLNEDWFTIGLPGIIRAKYVTGTQDRVVDRLSAKATWGNADAETDAGKGHIDLVKPERVDDAAVLILKNFLKMLAAVRPTEKEEPAPAGEQNAGTKAVAGLEAALNAQNQPVFEARLQGVVNDKAVCDRDYIILKNAGAPISQVNVKRLFSVYGALLQYEEPEESAG
jgi:predicted alpha/beta hydrolase family esterase